MVSIYIPKRNYSVKCLEDSPKYDGNKIVILGNYSKSNFNGTRIVSKYGIAPCVMENHGQVTGILV